VIIDQLMDRRERPASLLSETAAGMGGLVQSDIRLVRAELGSSLRQASFDPVRAAIAAVVCLADTAMAAFVGTEFDVAAASALVILMLMCISIALSAGATLRAFHGFRRDAETIATVFNGKGKSDV
jgi:hypothetical protein